MWGPGMGLGSGTGHIRLGPGPWAMIPSRQPGHGFETAGPSVLPPPSLVSAFATCCVPRLLQQVELHAVWLLQPVRLPLSVTVIGICLVQNSLVQSLVLKIAVAVAAGESLLQPLQRNTRFLPGTIVGTQNCWAAVPAGCANEFQTMLWGCSSRHSKDHAVELFQPAFHVYLNAGRQRHIQ